MGSPDGCGEELPGWSEPGRQVTAERKAGGLHAPENCREVGAARAGNVPQTDTR